MSHVKLTVVIPTRNRHHSLAQLLKSLSYQTLPPAEFEVVVVDDGSEPALRSVKTQPTTPTTATTRSSRDPRPGADGGSAHRWLAQVLRDRLCLLLRVGPPLRHVRLVEPAPDEGQIRGPHRSKTVSDRRRRLGASHMTHLLLSRASRTMLVLV